MTKLSRDNYSFELDHWAKGGGESCGARYMMDTVLYHEKGTSGLYRIKKYLQYTRGLTLEFGCNCGGITMTLCRNTDFVVGVDFMAKALRRANSKMKDLNNHYYDPEENWCHPPYWKINCCWVCAESMFLPFKDKAFDTVIYPEIIEHLPQDRRSRSVKEGYRILKDDGVFILSTQTDVSDPNRPNWLEDVLKYVHPHGLETEESVVERVKKANFNIVELEHKWHDKIKVIFVRCSK